MADSAVNESAAAHHHEPRPRERGAALLEFSVVVGLVMVLLGGIITYGLLLSFRQVLTQGATDGARAAAITADDPNTAVDERVTAARTALNASLQAVDRTCPASGTSQGLTCGVSIVACPNDAANQCVRIVLSQNNRTHPIVPPVFLSTGLTPETVSVSTMALVTAAGP